MCLDFETWKNAIVKPKETFKKEEKKASIGEGIKQIGIAGIISGILSGIAVWLGITTMGSFFGFQGAAFGVGLGITAFLVSVILTPIMAVISWLIWSGIVYIFAMIFGGKGSYATQSYLIALYTAPLMIIYSFLAFIPVIGQIITSLVGLYSLYLLTMALKQSHKTSTGKAVAIWLVPAIIIVIVLIAFAITAFSTLATFYGISNIPTI